MASPTKLKLSPPGMPVACNENTGRIMNMPNMRNA